MLAYRVLMADVNHPENGDIVDAIGLEAVGLRVYETPGGGLPKWPLVQIGQDFVSMRGRSCGQSVVADSDELDDAID